MLFPIIPAFATYVMFMIGWLAKKASELDDS